MDPRVIKEFVLRAGADACGVANVDRFADAPKGFHPKDVYSKCESVIVFIKQMPTGIIFADNPVPYTHAAQKTYEALDQIGVQLCSYLQKFKVNGIPIPADNPYIYWDQENMHGQGILSLRHAAYLAGLGILGKNTLLINEKIGNMAYIGAVLIDAKVEQDPLVEDLKCPTNCSKCLDACPQNALDGTTVNQKLCREKSILKTERGWGLYACSECRKACVLRLGKMS